MQVADAWPGPGFGIGQPRPVRLAAVPLFPQNPGELPGRVVLVADELAVFALGGDPPIRVMGESGAVDYRAVADDAEPG